MADASGTEIVQATAVEAPAPLISMTPMDLLARAVERGADLAMVEKLMDLAERSERNQARKKFDAAVAEAKALIKPVTRNRTGNNKTKYADLAAYAKEVDPILAQFGLSYRYSSRQDDRIHITCILSHRDGHNEETTLSSAPDGSGSKNSIQAIGSAVEYLKRYTLTLALGLSSEMADDDGKSADGDEPVSADQLAEIQAKIDSTGTDIEKFCRYLQIEALPDLRKKDYPKALAAIAQKIKTKKQAAGAQ